MKNLFILPFVLTIILCSCGAETKKQNAEKPESEKEDDVDTEEKPAGETFCFESKFDYCSEEKGKYLVCSIYLKFTEDQFEGKLDCKGCSPNDSEGTTDYKGTRNGDTLDMVETFLDAGNEVKTYSNWVIHDDSLILLAQASDMASLKSKKKKPILLYMKKNCD